MVSLRETSFSLYSVIRFYVMILSNLIIYRDVIEICEIFLSCIKICAFNFFSAKHAFISPINDLRDIQSRTIEMNVLLWIDYM